MEFVKASALPSLILALVFYCLPNLMSEPFQTNIPILFFGASFVGMVSSKILPKYGQVAVSGIIFALLYQNSSDFFNGFGGGLGTPACISVICVFGLKKLNALRKKKQK
jgi:hypothetical protein